jgi:hypothetical protein
MEQAKASDLFQNLASPVIGAGIVVNRLTQLFLLAFRGNVQDPASFAFEQLNASGLMVPKETIPTATPQESLAEMQKRFEKFQAQQLPVLRSVGIA